DAVPRSVAALYKKSIVIDALASPDTWNVPYPPPGILTPEKLANVRASGITAVNLTVGRPGSFVDTVKEIATWVRHIEQHPDHFELKKRHADIAATKKTGRLGIIFGFQGMGMIGEDLSLIVAFDKLWVRIMQLT